MLDLVLPEVASSPTSLLTDVCISMERLEIIHYGAGFKTHPRFGRLPGGAGGGWLTPSPRARPI